MNAYKVDSLVNRKSADNSILGKVRDYHEAIIKKHEELGLNVFKKSPVLSACDREVTLLERHTKEKLKLLMFGSNSYIGAINNEEIKNKTIDAVKEFGIGSGGVPILSGTTYYHEKLESIVSQMNGFEDTMLFSSGFTANLGAILGLIRPENLILQDRLNHASLIDGGLTSGAKMIRYKHNDLKDLEKILEEYHKDYPNGILIITDGVFSMDGDIADIPGILKLAKKYNAMLMIDEAHSTGVIGEKGAGTLSYHKIEDKSNIILTGTLSKAIGTVGGYVCASQEIIDYLRIYARSNLFSTSLPPSVCASAIAVIDYMQNSNVVDKLEENAKYLRDKLRANGFNILNTVTAIIPIIVGDEYKLTIMSKDLLDKGIFANCIFAPAVPAKESRIRINVMATHTKEDMDYLVDALNEIFKKYDLK